MFVSRLDEIVASRRAKRKIDEGSFISGLGTPYKRKFARRSGAYLV